MGLVPLRAGEVRVVNLRYLFTGKRVATGAPSECDPMDCSPSGSSVHGILQARILEWLSWWLRGNESTCQCRRHEFSP